MQPQRKIHTHYRKDEVLNTIVGYEAYSFVNGYSRYHQISIAPKDRYKIACVTD
jgi:hypothetical protein